MKIYKLTLAESITALEDEKLTPTELAMGLLERIKETEPKIHAWVTIDPEKVLHDVRKATVTERMSSFHGLLIGVKDIFNTAGTRTTMGSSIYRDYVPEYDAEIIKKIKKEGVIILGKTETTEFAIHDPAPTTNPWNTNHTPGGSSSGSAAAVSCGMCPAAFGTQTGGSIIRPASYCGIVGVKPTYDLLSRVGVFPLSWSLDHVGYMTRTVEDAYLMHGFLVSDERKWKKREAPPKIGVLRGYFKENAEQQVWNGYEKTITKLWGEGADMIELFLPDSFRHVHDVHRVIMVAEAASVHEEIFREKKQEYGEYISGFISSGLLVPATAYLKAQRLRTKIIKDLIKLVRDYDCVICPSTTDTAPKGLEGTGSPDFNIPWSLTGLPSVTIPSGISKDGLPIGLQLISAPHSDWNLLKVAGWCEEKIGFGGKPKDPYVPLN
jgi:Asp-tRNA(Asn)/Glu-tRNA(Gln) amidotransferase A subunit family amidase